VFIVVGDSGKALVGADFDLRDEVLNALSTTFAPAKVRSETRYLAKHRSFERPYGVAWLVLLGAAVAACAEPAARAWTRALQPLLGAARANVFAWLAPLRYPVRSGTHNQTAFALGLLHDAATATNDARLRGPFAARRSGSSARTKTPLS
jgi:hypothetical protein